MHPQKEKRVRKKKHILDLIDQLKKGFEEDEHPLYSRAGDSEKMFTLDVSAEKSSITVHEKSCQSELKTRGDVLDLLCEMNRRLEKIEKRLDEISGK